MLVFKHVIDADWRINMKAIQVVKPGDVRLVNRETPRIQKEDQVLMKVRAAGICGSDIHVLHGTNPVAVYPLVPGHEISGEVVDTGSAVSRLKSGDRVILEPITYCGSCYACKKGRQNVCESLRVNGAHVDGGFQEYLLATEKQLHKIPDSISFEQAALIEPYTIGTQANWRGGVTANDVVLVYGAGPIGLIVLDTARSIGASCIVSEVGQARRKAAQTFGADLVINPLEEDLENVVAEFTNNMGPNVIFEAAGVNALFEQAIKIASPAGTIVVMNLSVNPAAVAMAPIVKKELNIVGTRLQNNKFREVIDSFSNKLDNVNKLVTHTFDFKDFQRAFSAFEDRDSGVCKIVLTF